jgi:hypothetical protein
MKKKLRIELETGIQKLNRLYKMKKKFEEQEEAIMEAKAIAMFQNVKPARKR